jgi:hypothetical protein
MDTSIIEAYSPKVLQQEMNKIFYNYICPRIKNASQLPSQLISESGESLSTFYVVF